MQARPEFAPFGVTDPRRLAPYLERRSFAQGECIMRQGSAGGEVAGPETLAAHLP
jgi:hypothetical protein